MNSTLLSGRVEFLHGSAMKSHRRHAFEPEQVTSVVVEIGVTLDGRNKFVVGSKPSEVMQAISVCGSEIRL